VNPGLDDPALSRHGDRGALSLALMAARNTLLGWLDDDAPADMRAVGLRAGWYGEHWIHQHVQRHRGDEAALDAPRLGPPAAGLRPLGPGALPPAAPALRAALAGSLELTLDLLAGAPESDAGLHFYRMALRHEDRCAEQLALCALAAGRPLHRGLAPAPPARPQRPPLALPARTWMLGSPPGGCVPEGERWAHPVALPAFEIDAQPVSWAQFAEFATDGGYDQPQWWSPAGWQWVQREGRRAPRGVAQLAGAVLLERGDRLHQAHAGAPAWGLSRHEAQAWCAWAGRRLPTEPEWEAAACSAGTQGFAWGDVLEWCAGSGARWPGGRRVPGDVDPLPEDPHAPGRPGLAQGGAVLRGAAWLTPTRQHLPRARRFAAPGEDGLPTGFRSCAA
jgi:formylglycine-generating enzyme required for sulfatase activity